MAETTNRLNRKANSADLATIDVMLGNIAPPFEELYRTHDGMLLYREAHRGVKNWFKTKAAGIEFFPIRQWKGKSNEMRSGLLDFGWEEGDIQEWISEGIAFAEICHSANYFIVVSKGPKAGQIHYIEHDDYSDEPVAKNLEVFLNRLIANPAAFLFDMGCFTRYSDGQTETQWIPKKYISDRQY